MTKTMRTRALSVIVVPVGEKIFSEMATTIAIDDEGAGEFVVVTQHARETGKISICRNEWPTLRQAIDDMIDECEE